MTPHSHRMEGAVTWAFMKNHAITKTSIVVHEVGFVHDQLAVVVGLKMVLRVDNESEKEQCL